VNDRLSFSRFVGLGIEDNAPASTTVCRSRNTLVEANLYDTVLNEINRQLEVKGVIVKRGAIVLQLSRSSCPVRFLLSLAL